MNIDRIIRKHHKIFTDATVLYSLLNTAQEIYWDSDYSLKEQQAAQKAIDDIKLALKELDTEELDG